MGAVYFTLTSSQQLSKDWFRTSIAFNTNRKDVIEVVDSIKSVIVNLKNNLLDTSLIESIKKSYLIKMYQDVEEPAFWQTYFKEKIMSNEFLTYESIFDWEKEILSITPESIKRAAQKNFPNDSIEMLKYFN